MALNNPVETPAKGVIFIPSLHYHSSCFARPSLTPPAHSSVFFLVALNLSPITQSKFYALIYSETGPLGASSGPGDREPRPQAGIAPDPALKAGSGYDGDAMDLDEPNAFYAQAPAADGVVELSAEWTVFYDFLKSVIKNGTITDEFDERNSFQKAAKRIEDIDLDLAATDSEIRLVLFSAFEEFIASAADAEKDPLFKDTIADMKSKGTNSKAEKEEKSEFEKAVAAFALLKSATSSPPSNPFPQPLAPPNLADTGVSVLDRDAPWCEFYNQFPGVATALSGRIDAPCILNQKTGLDRFIQFSSSQPSAVVAWIS